MTKIFNKCKTQFWLIFLIWGQIFFSIKSGSVRHNFVWVSDTTPKFRINQWSNSKKTSGQTVGQTDRHYFIWTFQLTPGGQNHLWKTVFLINLQQTDLDCVLCLRTSVRDKIYAEEAIVKLKRFNSILFKMNKYLSGIYNSMNSEDTHFFDIFSLVNTVKTEWFPQFSGSCS